MGYLLLSILNTFLMNKFSPHFMTHAVETRHAHFSFFFSCSVISKMKLLSPFEHVSTEKCQNLWPFGSLTYSFSLAQLNFPRKSQQNRKRHSRPLLRAPTGNAKALGLTGAATEAVRRLQTADQLSEELVRILSKGYFARTKTSIQRWLQDTPFYSGFRALGATGGSSPPGARQTPSFHSACFRHRRCLAEAVTG